MLSHSSIKTPNIHPGNSETTPVIKMKRGSSFKDALNRTSRPIPGIKESVPANRNNNTGSSRSTTFHSRNAKESIKTNPFNMKVNKPKFEVLNRSDRGGRGNSVSSRTRAQAVRSATLLPQYKEQNRGHTSSFVDKRFGIKSSEDLSREEVMQERFAREQQRIAKKNSRKSKFDLNRIDNEADDNVDGLDLTHGGRNISQMNDDELEDFDDITAIDDEEDVAAYNSKRVGQIDRELVSAGHFGGFDSGSRDPNKSKQDVMKELIAKSKFYKLERQRVKEENEAMCEDLNEAFSAIRNNLHVLNEEDRKKIREEPVSTAPDAEEDEYEAMLKELAFDPRSKPSDRTLTTEEKEKKDAERAETQQKALLKRMVPEDEKRSKGKGVEDVDGSEYARDSDEEEENENLNDSSSVMDPELKRIAEKQFILMRKFCRSEGVEAAQEKYVQLIEYARKQPRTMIQLARALRTDIGALSTKFTEKSNASGRGALMPTIGPIKMLLLVSRLFSCSDFHHVVATPAQLLIAYYLGVGRMTKMIHVQRALALVYLVTEFQGIGQRCVPEALEILYTILQLNTGVQDATSHYFCRPLGKSLSAELKSAKKAKVSGSNFEKLFFKSDLSGKELVSMARGLTSKIFSILEDGSYPALREAARPFHVLLPEDEELGRVALEGGRNSLKLQEHKPMSIPLLTPDFSTDYSLDHRRRSGEAADEKSAARMKSAYKREYKGAVRELKRDSAFLADHKLKERRARDTEYKSKMNRIIGSIGNGK